MEWTWRWDSEWISTHTSDGYVYGYDEEDYGTDVKFLSTSAMSDAENSVSVDTTSSISSYMSITPSDDGLAANLECNQSFGCPIILTCTVYDEMDNSVSEDIRLDYDSVLGSLGTLEDWAEVESEREIEDALKTSCNIRLAGDIECSVEIEHRTHLDLNGHTLSGEADISKRARIENGKMTSSEDGIIAEGDEKIEITGVDIEAGKTGVIANSNVEISNCSVTGTSAYGIYASGGTVAATACEIKSEASDTDTHAAVYSASSASIALNGGSVEGGVGAWAYTGNVTLEDVFVTSTAGDGLKANQGTMKATGATIDSADSGAYCTNSGTVTLTSCTVTGTTYATYQSGGTLTVSGGELSGPNGCYCSNGITNLKDSCSVTATNSSGSAAYAAGGTINVTGCTLAGYYGVRQSSGSIDIERCSVTGSSYGIYISGQDKEPVIEYDDFVECSGYAVYNSSSSRTVEAYWCYTDGKETDAGYEDAEDRSVNVYCYPSYPESVTVSVSTPTTLYYGPTASTTSTVATASVTLKNHNLSYGDMPYDIAYGWTSSSVSVATVSSSTSDSVAITSAGVGSVTITCTVHPADKEVSGTSSSVTVTAQAPTSVTLSNPSPSTIYYGSTATTTTSTVSVSKVTMNDGTYNSSYASFSWSVASGSSYASVSSSGSSATVTSLKGGGTATVQCSVTYSGSSTSASGTSSSITVTAQAISSISLTASNSTIYYGGSTTQSTVTAKVSMNNGTYSGSYSWSYSGTSYISYSASGSTNTITAKSARGTATIQCSVTFDGTTKTASVSILVDYPYEYSVFVQLATSDSSYNGLWLSFTFTSSSDDLQLTSFSKILTALKDCYGTGSSNSFEVYFNIWDVNLTKNAYGYGSGYMSGNTLYATYNSASYTLTPYYFTVSGSSGTNGMFYYSQTTITVSSITAH